MSFFENGKNFWSQNFVLLNFISASRLLFYPFCLKKLVRIKSKQHFNKQTFLFTLRNLRISNRIRTLKKKFWFIPPADLMEEGQGSGCPSQEFHPLQTKKGTSCSDQGSMILTINSRFFFG